MGIQVECPHGHVFKVKDKYAGKKGLCPHCEGQVIVQVPDALTVSETDRNAAARSDSTPPGVAVTSRAFIDERFARVRRSFGTTFGPKQRYQWQPARFERHSPQHQVQVRPARADVVRPLPGMRGVFGSLELLISEFRPSDSRHRQICRFPRRKFKGSLSPAR